MMALLYAEQAILHKAIETWGREAQTVKCMEELAELTAALAHLYCMIKVSRTDEVTDEMEDAWEYVSEELADAEIMISQMRMIYDERSVDRWRVRKLNRLAERLGMTEQDGPAFGDWRSPDEHPDMDVPVLGCYVPANGGAPRCNLLIEWDGGGWVYSEDPCGEDGSLPVRVKLLGWMPLPRPLKE